MNEIGNRVLPYDYEAENHILGSIIQTNKNIITANEILKTSDVFYKLENKQIFEALNELYLNGKEFDMITLNQELKQRGLSINVKYLLNLQSGLLFQDYCIIVLDKYLKRKSIEISYNLIEQCYDDTFNIVNIIPDAVEKFESLRVGIKKASSNGEVLYQYLEDLQNGKINEIPTGYEQLDRILKGFRTGHFHIIAARPKTGKTTLILNIMYNQLINFGVPIKFYSLEQRKEEIFMKLLCRDILDNEINIKKDNLSIEKTKAKMNFLKDLDNMNLSIIDDVFGLNEIVNDIISSPEKLIYIDYNEFIREEKSKTAYERLDRISKTMTNVAKMHNKAIVMIQQIKTDVDGKEPSSDSIFYKIGIKDASKILLLYDKDNEKILKISENRFGDLGKVKFEFDGSKSYFKEIIGNFYDDRSF